MSYYTPDVYYQPEAFGLTILGTIERYEPDYSFDFVVVFLHEDGRIFAGQDSGCSCPSPFEDFTSLDKLDKIDGWAELDQWLKELAPQVDGYYSGNPNYLVEAAEIVQKVRAL